MEREREREREHQAAAHTYLCVCVCVCVGACVCIGSRVRVPESPKASLMGLEKGHDSFRNELLATNKDKTPLSKLPIREGYSLYMFIMYVYYICLLYLYGTNVENSSPRTKTRHPSQTCLFARGFVTAYVCICFLL